MPCVATGNVHAHTRERIALQDAMVAVRHGKTLDETEPSRRGNSSHVLAPPERMAERFREHPDAVEESGRLAERLRFDLTEDLGYRYPGSEDPDADGRLAELCRSLFDERYRGRRVRDEALARLDEELARDPPPRPVRLLPPPSRHARAGPRGGGRGARAGVRAAAAAAGAGEGSSVSSIVCYLTGLSHVDPIENELLLGRFLNEELTALPDIDLDFPRDIREVLIPRVHDRYGRDRCALVAAFSTFAGALGGARLRQGARAAAGGDRAPGSGGRPLEGPERHRGRRPAGGGSPRWQALVKLAHDAWGLPRHMSQHPGGMVISTQPLIDLCPVQPASMEGRQMVQWDKDSCGDAGFLKIDLLGLGMLSAVERCIDEIARVRGEKIDLSRIPYDDRRSMPRSRRRRPRACSRSSRARRCRC